MVAVVALFALLVTAVSAPAQTLTISSPGTYTLSADSISSGAHNIYISADVPLDLNGKAVRCQPSSPGSAVTFGIYVADGFRVTVRNGRVTGCFMGVHAGYALSITLDGVDFTGNTYIGAHLGYGSGRIVRNCRFANIAGYNSAAYAVGVNGVGDNGLVENSVFENIYRQPGAAATATGEGVGVLVESGATGAIIRNNTFMNQTLAKNAIGVWVATDASITASGNTFTNLFTAVQGSNATVVNNIMRLTGALDGAIAIWVTTGSATGNTIQAYPTAISGGITDGGNTITPAEPPTTPAGRWFRFCIDSGATCFEGYLPQVP